MTRPRVANSMSVEEFNRRQGLTSGLDTKSAKGNKFGAVKTTYKGRKYDSKAEASWAMRLDEKKAFGIVRTWLRQVPFDLGEDDRYRADFLVLERDGSAYAVDVKGVETPAWRRTRKLWAKYGPMPLHVIKGGKVAEIIEGGAA